MPNEVEDPQQQQQGSNPFAIAGGGQVAARPQSALAHVEAQRVVAEVQARMMIARANPRNPVQCMDAILQDCQRPTLAEAAVYQYSRGGTDIAGPSVRLLEAIAARWGNISSGFKEIGRGNGVSEVICEAWDLETGFHDYRQFQVRHWRDTKGGGYAIKDERDIYELIANMAQRRKRAVLQSVIPRDVVEAATAECERTLRAKADTSEEGRRKLVAAFEAFGVTREQIEKRIQRRIDAITPAQVVSLKKIYASLRDDMSVATDWFEAPAAATPQAGESSATTATGQLKEQLKAGKRAATPPQSDPAIGSDGATINTDTGEVTGAGQADLLPPDERTGTVPEAEKPTWADIKRLIDETDYEAATDLGNQLGMSTETQNAIAKHKKGSK